MKCIGWTMKEFELLDHEADVGIRSWGKTIEEAFENGARAMFSVMVNLDGVTPREEIKVEAAAEDYESLFVQWLNELLAQRDITEMIFSDFTVHIKKREGLHLSGTARGEYLSQEKHEIKTEVKAATYFGLKSGKKDELLFFQCVLDI
ncbi:MAG: archease [Theionarchaea archaeon]|nr:archease [Theionarchaea archaeon]MBU7033602.1 archease [Theionarchaea archaeon]